MTDHAARRVIAGLPTALLRAAHRSSNCAASQKAYRVFFGKKGPENPATPAATRARYNCGDSINAS